MSYRTDTMRTGGQADGTFAKTVTTEFTAAPSGDNEWLAVSVTDSTDATQNRYMEYFYDLVGRPEIQTTHAGPDRDFLSSTYKCWDDAGNLIFNEVSSIRDHKTSTTFTYDTNGYLSQEFAQNSNAGVAIPGEYDLKTFTNRPDGQVETWTVDSPMIFDFIVSGHNYFNAKGQVYKVGVVDEFRWGHEREHIIQTNQFNADGTPKQTTDWDGYANPTGQYAFKADSWFTSLDHKGYDKTFVNVFVANDPSVDKRMMIEEWHDANNNLTARLTSYDDQGNGGNLAAGGLKAGATGFDHRDVERWTFDAAGRNTGYTEDLGADSVIETWLTTEYSDALIA